MRSCAAASPNSASINLVSESKDVLSDDPRLVFFVPTHLLGKDSANRMCDRTICACRKEAGRTTGHAVVGG